MAMIVLALTTEKALQSYGRPRSLGARLHIGYGCPQED